MIGSKIRTFLRIGGDRVSALLRPAALFLRLIDRKGRHARPVPWVAALMINLLIFAVFATTARFRIGYDVLLAETAIPVTIINQASLLPDLPAEDALPEEEEPLEPEVEPEPEEAEEAVPENEQLPEQVRPSEPEEAPENIPEPLRPAETRPEPEPYVPPPPPPPPAERLAEEAEDPYAGLTGPEIDELYKRRNQIPQVALPEGQAGGISGVVAIFCDDVFTNDDKIQECAGRGDIRSGWRRTSEDWSGITASLRRGGVNVPGGSPYAGPGRGGDLGENETYYEPVDQGLIIGPKLARKLENERKFRDLQDERAGVMLVTDPLEDSLSNTGGGVPNYIQDQWEPSWTLRDDPVLDQATIEELERQRDGEE